VRFAYADPPYIGQARKHYAHDPRCAEVDHAELVARLETFDGWALSMSAAMYSLKEIIALAPDDSRMAAWVKPFASFKRGVAVAYTWEPVLFRTRRAWSRETATIKDHVIEPAVGESITLQRGLSGVKPERFNLWLFDLLGMTPADEFHDLFPGSGAVTDSWNRWRGKAEEPQGSLLGIPATRLHPAIRSYMDEIEREDGAA
jgi:hypothetical protein